MAFEIPDSASPSHTSDKSWTTDLKEIMSHVVPGKDAQAKHDFSIEDFHLPKFHMPDPSIIGLHRVSNFNYNMDKGDYSENVVYGMTVAGDAIAGGALMAVPKPGPVLYGAVGAALAVSAFSDFSDYSKSSSDRGRLIAGLALGGDVTMAAGVVARATSRSLPLAATILAVGAAAKIGSEFIPNHYQFQWPWER